MGLGLPYPPPIPNKKDAGLTVEQTACNGISDQCCSGLHYTYHIK